MLKIISIVLMLANYAHAQKIQEATVGQFPYVVLIYNKFLRGGATQICTGSLISKSIVLTSAICVYKFGNKVRESLTFAGIVDQADFRNDTVFYNKRFIISMNRHLDTNIKDDIALIFTSKMDLNEAIGIATLNASNVITGCCIALGFTPKVKTYDVDKALFYFEFNSSNISLGSMLDYEVTLPKEDIFLNDGALGAPLICSGKLVGIISHIDTRSMFYTSVAKYYGWIHRIVESETQMEPNVTESVSNGSHEDVNIIVLCFQMVIYITRIFKH